MDRIKYDINILLETWKGENQNSNIDGFYCISKSRKKNKKSRRHSGGIIIYIKNRLKRGVSYLKNITDSANRLWLKLDKGFFNLNKNLYLCAVYIPPQNSAHANDDFIHLETEITKLSNLGDIALLGDFNARTGKDPDFIMGETIETPSLDDMLPSNYDIDDYIPRNNMDNCINSHGQCFLNLCVSSRLRILNGRYVGDSLGYNTCYSVNGSSTVDYAVISKSLLSSVNYFCTTSPNYFSDHVQIFFSLKCNIDFYNGKRNNNEFSSKKCFSYKWTEQSSKMLNSILQSSEVVNDIINFELKQFPNNKDGINSATNNLTEIFDHISKRVCLIRQVCPKKVRVLPKKPWSDNVIRNLK